MLKAISIYVSSVNEKTGKLYVAKRFSDVQTINFVETHAHSLMA